LHVEVNYHISNYQINYHISNDYYQEYFHFGWNKQIKMSWLRFDHMDFRFSNINYRLTMRKTKKFTWHKFTWLHIAKNRLLISSMVFEKNDWVGWAQLKKLFFWKTVFRLRVFNNISWLGFSSKIWTETVIEVRIRKQ
jgi:hypothetical protein